MMKLPRAAFFGALALMCADGLAQDTRPPRAQGPVGPVGHWTGDDGSTPAAAADASGNGFKGTYAAGAGVSTEVPATKFPNTGSFALDGKTGVVSVPDAPLLQMPADFTLSFWKRKTAHNADWVRIVGKGNGAQRNFGLWEYPGEGGQLKFQCFSQGGASILELDSGPMPTINTWHHILCTVSVNFAALYVDGKPAGSAQRNGPPGIAPDPVTFGHAGYHGFFAGQIDDVRLYDRSLSMGEIVYLAAGFGAPAAPAGLQVANGALVWTASPTPPPNGTVTWYAVKRSKTSGSGFAPLASLLTSTSFVDGQAEPGSTYHYVVTALNTGGESGPSNEVKVTK